MISKAMGERVVNSILEQIFKQWQPHKILIGTAASSSILLQIYATPQRFSLAGRIQYYFIAACFDDLRRAINKFRPSFRLVLVYLPVTFQLSLSGFG